MKLQPAFLKFILTMNLAVALMVPSPSCWAYSDELLRVAKAKPKKDIVANLAKGDKRFRGYHGHQDVVPKADPELVEKYGVYYIPDTSNVFKSEEYAELNEKAATYAAKYNELLNKKLAQKEHPQEKI